MAYNETDPSRAAVAHVLRRATMAPSADALQKLSSIDDAINYALDAAPVLDEPPREEWYDTVVWWTNQMTRPDAGIHERMTWFWHTILTSSGYAANSEHMVGDQLQLLRTNALGNFRELLHGFVTDGLLISFLTADGSQASNPNENLARELMELFTMGPGDAAAPNYTQDDVRGAARALAGWVIEEDPADEDRSIARFERANSFVAPLIFLGEQANWDTAMIVERVCDHPSTARRIASILWTDLVGVAPTDAAAAELGEWWQSKDLDIKPLVGRILASKEFQEARLNRPRSGLEWWIAANAGLGFTMTEYWSLSSLEQVPYIPPNVGGWPRDARWLSVGALAARAQTVWGLVGTDVPPPHLSSMRDATERLGLLTLSDASLAAITEVDRSLGDFDSETANLVRWRSALCLPEFNLA